MSERIGKIKDAVETMHHCNALHVGSEPVIEHFRGKVVWDGVVDTFQLEGHPNAARCHAWSYEENGETQYVIVLELPPVIGPNSAVKVAIAAKARDQS